MMKFRERVTLFCILTWYANSWSMHKQFILKEDDNWVCVDLNPTFDSVKKSTNNSLVYNAKGFINLAVIDDKHFDDSYQIVSCDSTKKIEKSTQTMLDLVQDSNKKISIQQSNSINPVIINSTEHISKKSDSFLKNLISFLCCQNNSLVTTNHYVKMKDSLTK